MAVPHCSLTIFSQVLFSGHFWDFFSGQDWKPKAGLRSSSSPTFPSGSTANLSLSSSLPLLTLTDGRRWGLETGKQEDEQCKRRGSILPNSPFFLKYFGIFVLKQSSTREDEGGPRLNLSAERELWQEVCLSSSFCNFVLARGTVLTSPGAWKSFPSIGQADAGIPSLHLETKLHGRRKTDSRFMLGLMCPVLLRTTKIQKIYGATRYHLKNKQKKLLTFWGKAAKWWINRTQIKKLRNSQQSQAGV